ncbi:MAG TPA: efflux RND transporter periplasmic adaptor subunit, partial [Thermoanaerobaculia bacterium]|nr:efflux RND transporter periplasmic adaptor subunit [Thermoanaerobaculia bacterium]
VVGVVLVLGLVLWGSLRGSRNGKGKEVYAEPAKRRDISEVVKATGQIDPRVKVNISAHVVAKIARLFVVEGQEVKAGQPFLELEKYAFSADRDRAAAAREIANSQKRQAQVDLANAELQLGRTRNLKAQGIASREQLDAAELRERSARLQLEQAGESIREAQAGLERAQDELRKTTLFAPITGRVIQLSAKEGEVVVSGTMNNPASIIATVADLSELLIEVDVDETDIVDVALAQPAELQVDAIPDSKYHGKVVEIGSSGYSRPQQPDVTFFKVKILLTDPDQRLRPGMSARAEIKVATHDHTVVVPVETVVYRQPLGPDGKPKRAAGAGEEEVKVAFVVDKGKAVQRAVTTGIADATHVEITTGIKDGEQVITGPHRILKNLDNGDAVQIAKPEKEKKGKGKESDEDKEKDKKDEDKND